MTEKNKHKEDTTSFLYNFILIRNALNNEFSQILMPNIWPTNKPNIKYSVPRIVTLRPNTEYSAHKILFAFQSL